MQRAVENPTLVERFICLIHLPYPLAVLFWSVVLGSPGFFTVQYLVTGASTFTLNPSSLANEFLFVLVPYYLFFMVGYMRRKIVAGEAPIVPRLAEGEEDYHKAFRGATSTLPVILLATILSPIALTASFGDFKPNTLGLAFFDVLSTYLSGLAFSTYLWMFANASLGLHRLGGSSLKLGSYLEERMMGAKPLGNLALSLTAVYYGGVLLLILLFYNFIATNLPLQAFLAICLLLGVGFFFLPLNSIHKRMQAEKRRLQRDMGARYSRLTESVSPDNSNASLDDVRNSITRLTDLQQLEMLDRKVSSLPTWPFDIQVVSKFITIVLSVTAVLLSRVITGFLHI
jgi:hypothetical protein